MKLEYASLTKPERLDAVRVIRVLLSGSDVLIACQSERKCMTGVIPIESFQKDDLAGAGEYVFDRRSKGVVAGAFVASDSKSETGDRWGTLFVGMPETHGITEAGHEAVKARFHTQVFRQGEQIGLWMKEADVKQACDMLSVAILPFKQT